MIDLKYSLIIEAAEDLTFLALYSPGLEGFTGVGDAAEDCISKAKRGMEEHVALLNGRGVPVPEGNPNPTVTSKNARLAGVS